MDRLEGKVDSLEGRMDRFEKNNQTEHRQLMQMIKELNNEVQFEIKRIK